MKQATSTSDLLTATGHHIPLCDFLREAVLVVALPAKGSLNPRWVEAFADFNRDENGPGIPAP